MILQLVWSRKIIAMPAAIHAVAMARSIIEDTGLLPTR
jgi:hypothetical protein